MKIALNATCLNNRPSGAKQRFIGLYNELFLHCPNDEFVIYEPIDCKMSSWFEGTTNVVFKQTPLHSEKRFQKFSCGQLYWPSTLKTLQPDLFESYHLPVVKAPTGQTLLTIHDIRGLVFLSGLERTIYKTILNRSLKITNQIITVSESMRNDILQYYPDLKISVIYNGIDTSKYDAISDDDLITTRQKFSLPDNFLLAVGHFEHRKNYLTLIEAMARLHERGITIHLVIVGNDSNQMNIVKERIHSLGISDYIIIFNGLSDFDVRCFYKLCKLFVFPSAYEGFGIPILEAMAAKCPMVLSDIPVFREITQEQGVYFPHNDSEAIADAIDKVLSSDSEITRLIQYGNQRVQDFSFSKISMDLVSLYKSLF
jgi:glycosyltransferase involved in cell wall biosynthesis